MNNTVSEPKTRRKLFSRIYIVTIVILVAGLAMCVWTTLRFWQAINSFREGGARLSLGYVGPAWVPEGCRFLPGLMEASSFFRTVSLSESELQCLNRIDKIGYLWLHQSNLDDKKIKIISGVHARILHIELNDVTDVGVAYLSKMTSLQELYLDENPVTDAALNSLKSLPKLQKLSVAKTSVTRAAAIAFSLETGVDVIGGK